MSISNFVRLFEGDIFQDTMREIQAEYEAAIQAAGDADAIEMTHPRDPHRRVLITRLAQDNNQWRATRYSLHPQTQAWEPWGHSEYPSREKAISDHTGGHITPGPAYGNGFVVTRTRKFH